MNRKRCPWCGKAVGSADRFLFCLATPVKVCYNARVRRKASALTAFHTREEHGLCLLYEFPAMVTRGLSPIAV